MKNRWKIKVAEKMIEAMKKMGLDTANEEAILEQLKSLNKQVQNYKNRKA